MKIMKILSTLFVFIIFFNSVIGQEEYGKVFVYTESNKNKQVKAFHQMAGEEGWLLATSSNAIDINLEHLQQYDVVIFLNISNEELPKEFDEELKSYLKLCPGKGFIAIGDAVFSTSKWYQELVGSNVGTAYSKHKGNITISKDSEIPHLNSTPNLKMPWTMKSSFYHKKADLNGSTTIPLLNLVETKGSNRTDYPIAWYNQSSEFDCSSPMFTVLGKKTSIYKDENFYNFLKNEILIQIGKKETK